jgi:flagellar biosynthesis/type III secretory pathway ATPase
MVGPALAGALRDVVLSQGLSAFGRHHLKDISQMFNLSVDSRSKVIRAEVLLAGEREPVLVEIHGYGFCREETVTYLTFERLAVSREWMGRVLDGVLKKRRIRLPEGLGTKLLESFM